MINNLNIDIGKCNIQFNSPFMYEVSYVPIVKVSVEQENYE